MGIIVIEVVTNTAESIVTAKTANSRMSCVVGVMTETNRTSKCTSCLFLKLLIVNEYFLVKGCFLK